MRLLQASSFTVIAPRIMITCHALRAVTATHRRLRASWTLWSGIRRRQDGPAAATNTLSLWWSGNVALIINPSPTTPHQFWGACAARSRSGGWWWLAHRRATEALRPRGWSARFGRKMPGVKFQGRGADDLTRVRSAGRAERGRERENEAHLRPCNAFWAQHPGHQMRQRISGGIMTSTHCWWTGMRPGRQSDHDRH